MSIVEKKSINSYSFMITSAATFMHYKKNRKYALPKKQIYGLSDTNGILNQAFTERLQTLKHVSVNAGT